MGDEASSVLVGRFGPPRAQALAWSASTRYGLGETGDPPMTKDDTDASASCASAQQTRDPNE